MECVYLKPSERRVNVITEWLDSIVFSCHVNCLLHWTEWLNSKPPLALNDSSREIQDLYGNLWSLSSSVLHCRHTHYNTLSISSLGGLKSMHLKNANSPSGSFQFVSILNNRKRSSPKVQPSPHLPRPVKQTIPHIPTWPKHVRLIYLLYFPWPWVWLPDAASFFLLH